MKYMIVLLVVAVAAWMLLSRTRRGVGRGASEPRMPRKSAAMARCAHCGVHLPASEALIEGASVYCSDDHRRLGPGTPTGQ